MDFLTYRLDGQYHSQIITGYLVHEAVRLVLAKIKPDTQEFYFVPPLSSQLSALVRSGNRPNWMEVQKELLNTMSAIDRTLVIEDRMAQPGFMSTQMARFKENLDAMMVHISQGVEKRHARHRPA